MKNSLLAFLCLFLVSCGGVGSNNDASGSLSAPAPPFTQNSQPTTVTITSTVGGGVAPFLGTEHLIVGDVLDLQATPVSGYLFDHWITNGILTGPDTTALNAVPVINGLSVEAVFIQIIAN
jgi:Divergent InlB B-repeat domain